VIRFFLLSLKILQVSCICELFFLNKWYIQVQAYVDYVVVVVVFRDGGKVKDILEVYMYNNNVLICLTIITVL
jgi:hypothetical protein